jgi:RHS repeat-associated protein
MHDMGTVGGMNNVKPFLDDFNDGNTTGWFNWGGTWSAAGGVLAMTAAGAGYLAQANSDADHEARFDYRFTDTAGGDYGHFVFRFESSDDYLSVLVLPGYLELRSAVNGTVTALDTASIGTTDGQWYTLRAQCDGANVTVWRSTPGELETAVLTTTAAVPLTTSYLTFGLYNSTGSTSPFQYDNIRIFSDSLSTTTTFAVNAADELTSATVSTGGTTYFEYDAWGRMARKYMGSSGSPTFEAVSEYKYDDKLMAVTSNFPDEGNVSYTYGGDGQRRSRTADAVTRHYNWSPFGLLNEANNAGNLVRSHVGRVADISGANPASGSYNYPLSNMAGSVRARLDASGIQQGVGEYSPYGDVAASAGDLGLWSYAGNHWDAEAGMFLLAYRCYSPSLARWTTPEPSGKESPNLYWYCMANPSTFIDVDGLSSVRPGVIGAFILGGAIGGGITGAVCGLTSNAPGAPRWENVLAGAAVGATAGIVTNSVIAGTVAGRMPHLAPLAIGVGAFGAGITSFVGSGGNGRAGLNGAGWGGITTWLGMPHISLVNIGFSVSTARGTASIFAHLPGSICAP